MVRLKDIAERAAVSVMTVSKALRDAPDVSSATKTRIKALAQQLGYVPDSFAQGLRTRTSRLFGLVVPSCADPFFTRVVLGIEERAYELGYDLILLQSQNVPEREEMCIRRCLARRVDGLFVIPAPRFSGDARVFQEIMVRKVPTVFLDHPPSFASAFSCAHTDDLLGGYIATQHLVKLGHKRIAFLTGTLTSSWAHERFEGYRRALREAGWDVDEKLVFQAGRTFEDGEKAGLQMLNERCGATAVQGANDLVAIGCAEVLLQQGFTIPGNISVMGFGNVAVSERYRVPLTTMGQPKYRLGATAVTLMQQLLKDQRPEIRRIQAELVLRASTGTAPATSFLV